MPTLQMAANLWQSDDEREFFVLVPPRSEMVQHNLGAVGSFNGGPLVDGHDTPQNLPFVRNENSTGILMSPFHMGLINWYTMDYNLELQRHHRYKSYPSRFHALYLLNTRDDAQRYRETHESHSDGRLLKRCITNGKYRYSIHDSAWIEFLRCGAFFSDEVINDIADEYWSGRSVDGKNLSAMGKPFHVISSLEVLFYGQVLFPNRRLDNDD